MLLVLLVHLWGTNLESCAVGFHFNIIIYIMIFYFGLIFCGDVHVVTFFSFCLFLIICLTLFDIFVCFNV